MFIKFKRHLSRCPILVEFAFHLDANADKNWY